MGLLPSTTKIDVTDSAYNLNLKAGDKVTIYDPIARTFTEKVVPEDGLVTFQGAFSPFVKQVIHPFISNPPEKCPCGGTSGTVLIAGAANEILISPVNPTGLPAGSYQVAVFNGAFYVPDGGNNCEVQVGENAQLHIGEGTDLPDDATTYKYFRLTNYSPNRTYHWSTSNPTNGTWAQIG